MADMVGPFDYHLTQRILELCAEHDIPHQRDVFRFYRSDSAPALEAGNDIRPALVCVGVDASPGYERTHPNAIDRKRVVTGKSVSVRLDHGGRRHFKKKK